MNASEDSRDRQRRLIAELLDGTLSDADSADLNRLLQTDPQFADQVANQLILDSLLSEELGAEPLAALVDMVGQPSAGHVTTKTAAQRVRRVSKARRAVHHLLAARRTWQIAGGLAILAVIGFAFVMGRWERMTLASSSDIVVRSAMDAHAAPVERVYAVQTERSTDGTSPKVENAGTEGAAVSVAGGESVGKVPSVGFKPPRDVRVATQGDRFYVEMNRGDRRWCWGLDRDGSIWIALGARRAIVIDRAEWGPALHHISSLYTLNVETLLNDLLTYCELRHKGGSEGTHIITATPRRRWNAAGMRRATIEVDRETKAVRRLVIDRDIPQQGASTVTFTLVDTRAPDEDKYRPQGHLVAPYRLLTPDTRPDLRRELMANWFGPLVERWLKTPEAKSP